MSKSTESHLAQLSLSTMLLPQPRLPQPKQPRLPHPKLPWASTSELDPDGEDGNLHGMDNDVGPCLAEYNTA